VIEALSKRVQALETCCRYQVVEPIWSNRQLNLKTPLEKCSVEADQKKKQTYLRWIIYLSNSLLTLKPDVLNRFCQLYRVERVMPFCSANFYTDKLLSLKLFNTASLNWLEFP
jgi:hypothetical protein